MYVFCTGQTFYVHACTSDTKKLGANKLLRRVDFRIQFFQRVTP